MNTYQSTSYQKLMHFLRQHRAVTDVFTHTSIDRPRGKFNIPEEKEAEFYNLYHHACFVEKEDLYLTEKPNIESSPFRCDLDFRMKQSTLDRQYTMDDIKHVMQTHMSVIEKWTSFENEEGESNDSQRLCFVFEKSTPRWKNEDDAESQERIVKDGVHLVWPYLVSNAYLHEIVRSEVSQTVALDHLNLKNSMDDVFDPAVIFRNNWQLFGSKKPNNEAYQLTHIFKTTGSECTEISIDNFLEANGGLRVLVHQMKIRRPENECIQIREEKQAEFNNLSQHLKHFQQYEKVNRNAHTLKKTKLTDDEMGLVKKLVGILKPSRADNYKQWIEVGWCLNNIHNVDDSLLETWIEFSKQSDAYRHGAEEACIREWSKSISGGLQIGTLNYWAKTDNLSKYRTIIRKYHSEMLSEIVQDFTEYEIAKCIHTLYKTAFVCVSVKDKRWYRYNGNRWCVSEHGIHLKRLIATEIYEYVTKNYMAQLTSSQSSDSDGESDNFDRVEENLRNRAKEMEHVKKKCRRLRTPSFKSGIMSECMEIFYDYAEEFCEKLDSNNNLLGFDNGVYELDSGIFRDGRAEDFLTLSTKNDYIEYNWNDPTVKAVLNFFSKIYTNPKVREYVLRMLASFLSGSTREEKFPIWTGSGSNGKSKVIELLKGAVGEYYGTLPVTLLTKKRADAGNANPHMAATRGKRILVMQEPDTHTKLNVGLMKEYTGGDPIVCRALYEKPFEFKPQFHMILVCNDMPDLPPEDQAVWRRVRVTQHRSKFTECPSPHNPLEFEKDMTLTDQIKGWHEAFMWILLQYYKKYLHEGLNEPHEVLKYTAEYQKKQDHVATFIQDRVKQTDSKSDILYFNELFDEYKFYVRENFNGVTAKNRTEFTDTMTRKMGQFDAPSSGSQRKGWIGYAVISKFDSNAEGGDSTGECLLSA